MLRYRSTFPSVIIQLVDAEDQIGMLEDRTRQQAYAASRISQLRKSSSAASQLVTRCGVETLNCGRRPLHCRLEAMPSPSPTLVEFTSPMPFAPKRQLGAYEIICSLGIGGMGEVYRARDTRLGRDVALKILPPEVTNEPGRLERFDREARAIAALNHPHIVTIYSTEEADSVRFLTMELVDGHTLGELIAPNGLPMAKFLDIALPLADALAAAHQQQITHRDLKPGNVMLTNDGRVKVLDFGLARVGGAEADDQTLIATQAPITHQGMIVGTMPYMSPEQVEGRSIDARSDLFSLGVLFYELLSGDRPFKGVSSPALMSAILRDTPPSVTEKRDDIPEGLDRLLSRLIEKRPEDRVQTARDVFNELRHVRKQLEPGSDRTPAAKLPTQDVFTIAVRPFVARGPDEASTLLAEGLTDDIINGLSRFGYLRVLSRAAVAAAAEASYTLTGQVRKSGGSLRVSAALADNASGMNIWAEHYDRTDSESAFAIQDDVAASIIATIGDHSGVLGRSAATALADRRTDQLNIAELVVRYYAYAEQFRPEEHARLRTGFERALEREPRSADGWALLAMLYHDEYALGLNPLPEPLSRLRQAAERAVESDPRSQHAWVALATSHLFARDLEALRGAVDRAIAINPLNADTAAGCAVRLAAAAQYDRAEALVRSALAHKSQPPGWYYFPLFHAHFISHEHEEALSWIKLVNMPLMPLAQFAVASVAGHLGLAPEARPALEALRAIDPQLLDPARARQAWAVWMWDETYLDHMEEGVRKALLKESKRLA